MQVLVRQLASDQEGQPGGSAGAAAITLPMSRSTKGKFDSAPARTRAMGSASSDRARVHPAALAMRVTRGLLTRAVITRAVQGKVTRALL